MQDTDPWSLSVVRANGLFFLRPEKSWRPIVTIEVDEHERYETVLGCDGQNTNMKALFRFHQVDANSRVDIKIWHRSQSKKKGKKRNLVATACHSLTELLKKQTSETKVEVRLTCQSPQRRRSASRGKPQNGALILLNIRPPASFLLMFRPSQYEDDSSSSAETLLLDGTQDVAPLSPTSDNTSASERDGDDIVKDERPKKRRIRGYTIDSDDCNSESASGSEDCGRPLLPSSDDNAGWFDDSDISRCDDAPDTVGHNPPGLGWLMASVLPTYTERIEVTPSAWFWERIISSFTTYHELKNAMFDSQYEAVFTRLQSEWTFVGGLLVALAAVDTAVFAIPPGSLFDVDKCAQNAIAASSIASGLGISCDAWFLLRYNWADLQTFKTRSKDVYDSYFFFALSSRLPALSMLTSTISLMVCLGRVAYNSWPEAVIVMCLVFGVIMTLQFLVFGAHWCANRVIYGGRAVLRKFSFEGDTFPPPYTATK